MKKKVIESAHFYNVWRTGVEELLFPGSLVKELNPSKILEDWGERVIQKRIIHRAAVNDLIEKIVDFDVLESIWSILLQAPPDIMALYYDRVEAATHALDYAKDKKEYFEIPESWETVVRGLLLQKFDQWLS